MASCHQKKTKLINTEDKEFRNAEDTKFLNSEDTELRNVEDPKLINSEDKELRNAEIRIQRPDRIHHFSCEGLRPQSRQSTSFFSSGTSQFLTRMRVCPPAPPGSGRGHSGGSQLRLGEIHCGNLGMYFVP